MVGDTLYVVVGAYYKTWTDSYGNTASPKKAAFGGQQAGVPTMFYYAMLRTRNAKSGKSVLRCSREELQCAAFVMSHAMQKGHKPSRQRYAQRRGSRAAERVPVLYQRAQCAQGYL